MRCQPHNRTTCRDPRCRAQRNRDRANYGDALRAGAASPVHVTNK